MLLPLCEVSETETYFKYFDCPKQGRRSLGAPKIYQYQEKRTIIRET